MANRVSTLIRVSLLIVVLLGISGMPAAASPIVVAATFADELQITIPDPPIDFVGPVFLDFDISGVDAGESVQMHAGELVGGIIVNIALFQEIGGIYVPISPFGFSATPLPQLVITQAGSLSLVNDGLASIFLSLEGPVGATAEFNSLVVSGLTGQRTQQSLTVGAAAVPEPASLMLVGTGLSLLAAVRRRKSRVTRPAA